MHKINKLEIDKNLQSINELQEHAKSFKQLVDDYKTQIITEALTQTYGNIAAAAELLCTQRTTLSMEIDRLKIDKNSYRPNIPYRRYNRKEKKED